MHIIADLHTHTLVSQHAYSTIDELSHAASAKGFCALAITDHGPAMPDGAIQHHFFCLRGLPSKINDLTLYKGAEANIIDYNGKLDLDNSTLELLDFVIASYHIECIPPSNIQAHTTGLLQIIKNPVVDCIGHCGNPVFRIDPLPVVKACAKYDKLIEINSASFKVRPGSSSICREIAKLCIKYRVKVIVSSDAHSKWQVGEHTDAIKLLEELHFPEELVINSTKDRLFSYFSQKGIF